MKNGPLDSRPFDLRVNACRDPVIQYMGTKYSSSRFLLQRGHTDPHTHSHNATDLSTDASSSAGVSNDIVHMQFCTMRREA